MRANYHTHTRWCRHGEGEIEDYIKQAIACSLEEVAITEHVPHDNIDRRRMHWDEFESYNAQLDMLIEKYSGQIRVIKGFECEYYPDKLDAYRMLRDKYGYKLLILGHHTSVDRTVDNFAASSAGEVQRYADEVCEALESGLFTFLAHPDVVLCGYGLYDEVVNSAMSRIFQTCEDMRIPVEINANGMRDHRRYPDRSVWELSKRFDLIYLINSDAHYVEHLCDEGIAETERFAQELGITVTETLDGILD